MKHLILILVFASSILLGIDIEEKVKKMMPRISAAITRCQSGIANQAFMSAPLVVFYASAACAMRA